MLSKSRGAQAFCRTVICVLNNALDPQRCVNTFEQMRLTPCKISLIMAAATAWTAPPPPYHLNHSTTTTPTTPTLFTVFNKF